VTAAVDLDALNRTVMLRIDDTPTDEALESLAGRYRQIAACAPHRWLAKLTDQELRNLRRAVDDELGDQVEQTPDETE